MNTTEAEKRKRRHAPSRIQTIHRALLRLRQPGCRVYSYSRKEVRQSFPNTDRRRGPRSWNAVNVCNVVKVCVVMVCGHCKGHRIRSWYGVME